MAIVLAAIPFVARAQTFQALPEIDAYYRRPDLPWVKMVTLTNTYVQAVTPGETQSATRHQASRKRGRQPIWLCKIMNYHIQPIAKKQGITKRIGCHTFRRTYTTLLHANGEDVKVVQELLRHGSAKITMDVYARR